MVKDSWENELREKIHREISKTGFPSELESWNVLEKSGWRPESSFYYLDLDENCGREFDLWAYNMFSTQAGGYRFCVWIVLVIEVKKTVEPTVVFMTPAGDFEAGGYGLLHWSENLNSDWQLSYEDIERCRPGAGSHLFGRTSYRPFKNDTTFLQAGILSACKASVHRLLEHEESEDAPDNERPKNVYMEFVLPTVIFDGPLFMCSRKEDGALEVVEADYIPYTQNYVSAAYKHKIFQCDIVRLSSLADHLKKLDLWGAQLNAAFHENVRAHTKKKRRTRGGTKN